MTKKTFLVTFTNRRDKKSIIFQMHAGQELELELLCSLTRKTIDFSLQNKQNQGKSFSQTQLTIMRRKDIARIITENAQVCKSAIFFSGKITSAYSI